MNFLQFDKASLDATEAKWHRELKSVNGFSPTTDRLLKDVRAHLGARAPSLFFGIFSGKSSSAVAISEFVITPKTRGNVVKLLNLHLSPMLEQGLYNNDVGAINRALDAYTCSVVSSFEVGGNHNASTLKVYGRTHEQLSMLSSFAVILQAKTEELKFSVKVVDRWLEIKHGG